MPTIVQWTIVGILIFTEQHILIVYILTYMNRISTRYESFKARKVIILWYFSFYERLKFHAQLS